MSSLTLDRLLMTLLSAALLETALRGTARAETATVAQRATGPVEQKPLMVPPRLIQQMAVPYPDGASGDAKILLIVTVNADGSVRSVQAETETPPFSKAAEMSVQGWRFEPATRDGTKVAARIKLEVAFHAPVTREPEDLPAPDAPAPAAAIKPSAPSGAGAGASRERPIEVTVQGEKRAPMVVSLGRAEVRQIPGTMGDPFRALEILPGVTPIMSGLPYFYVRGAPPGNVGYYLDGIRVPYLFHVAIGPSVIHPAMVDRVDLYPGGYPARFGRYAGGIAAAETTPPNPNLHGEASVRLYDAGAMVETGFDHGRGTVLLGGRYSYTAAIISLVADGIKLDYRDYQARVSYDLTPRDQISLFTFGAYDLIAQEANGISTIGFGTEFYRGELRWDRRIGGDGRLRTAVTLGYDQTAIGGERNAQNRLGGVRTEFEQQLSRRVRLRAGADSLLEFYRVTSPVHDDPDDPNSQMLRDLFPPRRDAVVGVHGEAALEIRPGFVITPGLRLDYYLSGGAGALGVDPRLSARQKLSKDLALVEALGVAHQPPSFVLPIPGLALGTLKNGLQTAYQTSAGIEWNLATATQLTTSVFYNLFADMTDALSVPEGMGDDLSQRTRGRAYGWEVFLHRRLTQNLGGFLSYTLSRSERHLHGRDFPSAFDRRHVVNAALAYNLGRRWRAGTRVMAYTGAPKRDTSTNTGIGSEAPIAAGKSALLDSTPARDPAFCRLDVRIEKNWQLSRTAHVSFVAEVLNATASKERFNGTAIGPIVVPSIGVEGGF